MTLMTRGSAPFHASFTVLAALLSLLNGRTDLLFSEDFSYANGPLTSVSPGTWSNHSGSAEEVQVRDQAVLMHQFNSEDANAGLPGGPYPTSTNATLYWSLRLTVMSLPTGSAGNFAHLNSTAFRSRLFITTSGAAAGSFRLGLSNGTSSPDVILPIDLHLNSESVALVRYNPATGISALWVDPASAEDENLGITALDPVTPVSVNRVALRQAPGIGSLRIDDMKVGTAWDDVYATPNATAPVITLHPQGQTIIEETLAVFFSQAAGTPPLHYQWFKDGSPVPEATNTSLMLKAAGPNLAGNYVMTAGNAAGMVSSDPAVLVVKPAPPPDGLLRVVTWNVKGNGATDWSIDSSQVQAIGRKLGYLAPDIITFNEIPVSFTYQMTNWVAAFLPRYQLAANSGSDGFIRSVIASRHPILSSGKHLDGVTLAPFGTGNFTRDLFQARIRVPGYMQPLDVFTTHLKATTSGGQSDADKRAAEAKVISNFVAHVYLPTNNGALYLLTGDLNEDVARPDTNRYITSEPIQNLANPQTGLLLTTPTNLLTGQDFTLSIQTSLSARFDYVLPCAILSSNLVYEQVFRTDVLTDPPVAEVYTTDSRTASDHLPVMLSFANPYPPLQPVVRQSEITTISWETTPGQKFSVKSTSDLGAPLAQWTTLAEEFLAAGYRSSLSITSPAPSQFFKILPKE